MAPVPPSGRAGTLAGERPDSPLCPNGSKGPRSASTDARLDTLLSDLGAQLQRGDRIQEPLPRLSTGLDEIDHLLQGGFPLGRLCEVSGSTSSGRTSLALSLLACTTQSGECVAVVDPPDAFDPPSAASMGVDLDRVLWVRPASWDETLRAVERLLDTEGFPLILLDLARNSSLPGRIPALLLARRAASSRTALVLLSTKRVAGSQAEIALEMKPARAHFTGSPAVLEELETHAVVVRHRSAPDELSARVRLATRSRAA